jgi:exopolyphosphatase/guanosine-5'-triphosphate,3'-diphosphate pyrophosphatase
MREGVIYDLLGRLQHEDVRDRTIHLFQERFHVDTAQARRVEETATDFLASLAAPWKLDGPEPIRFLAWAARLHEIGLAVSFDEYTRHGAYLIENTDMPGFSRDDQVLLALLIRSHRGKLRRSHFKRMPGRTRRMAIRLTVLLRIAVRLHRHRSAEPRPAITFRPYAHRLVMEFPQGWLDAHAMTRLDLEKEAVRLAPLGFQLEVRDQTPAPGKRSTRQAT